MTCPLAHTQASTLETAFLKFQSFFMSCKKQSEFSTYRTLHDINNDQKFAVKPLATLFLVLIIFDIIMFDKSIDRKSVV